MSKKKPRGRSLDERLKLELEEMIQLGVELAPISRSALQKRLGLTSRGTLAVKSRAALIEKAREMQFKAAGLNESGTKRRNTVLEQNQNLKGKIKSLESERDTLLEKLAMIINGIQARGLNLEEIMIPLRPNFNKHGKQ
ncbi:hypothetical protein [Sporocytophaga myxococcoides]|uniref:hypothetical protein n=1 Tax=Sporocytophaga myxococcoides TaxID=153721 RepID=UPI0004056B4B|nr:hypothetical protein [Sporocytophaga myxococcoides]